MKRICTYIRDCLAAVLLLGSVSCTERVDIELDSTYRRLIVEAEVTTDSVHHWVILTTSGDYFVNEPAIGVSGGMVELSFENQILALTEIDSLPGTYETPFAFRGMPGTTYYLDISQVDIDQDGQYENYHATSTMPSGAELHSIELRYFETPIVSGYVVQMYANHPPDQPDWFGFKIRNNGRLLTDTLIKYNVFSDELFDDGYLPGLPVGFLSDDDPLQAAHPGDTITFELNCIELFYYEFITAAHQEIIGNNPLFSGPPANIKSNISNGARGAFAAFSVQRTSTIVP